MAGLANMSLEDLGDLEHGDIIPLTISYTDNSGMEWKLISSEADDGALTFRDAEVATGHCLQWKISLVFGKVLTKTKCYGGGGVGPYEGDTSYWSVDDFESESS